MKRRSLLFLVMALALGVSSGFAQSIDIVGDPLGATCQADIPPGLNSGQFFIIARVGGGLLGQPNGDGITVAEFKVTGFPAGPIVTIDPNPNSNVNLGNPLTPAANGDHFANQAYPSCDVGSNGIVILYTCTVSSFGEIPASTLRVENATPPTSPLFTTPILAACNPPAFTAFVASGGQFFINPDPAAPDCNVAVAEPSWGEVKGLFR